MFIKRHANETHSEVLQRIIHNDAENASAVAANMDSCLLMDLDVVVAKYREWQACLPRIHPYYAVKCNDSMPIVRLLAALGCGFDCASGPELEKVCDVVGVQPELVVFANPIKDPAYLRLSREMGVRKMTFDSVDEVDKICDIYPDAELILRIRSDAKVAALTFGSKFGVRICEVRGILQYAKSRGVYVSGVSFHVGTDCREPEAFARGIRRCRRVFDIAREIGYEMSLVDIGGGFPGDEPLASIAQSVRDQFGVSFPTAEYPDLRLIAEPGRYMVAAAGTVGMRTIGVNWDNDVPRAYFTVGDRNGFGVLKKLRNWDLSIERLFPKKSEDSVSMTMTLWGPTGEDILNWAADAPPNLKCGDWTLTRNFGAYCSVFGADSHTFGLPKAIFCSLDSAMSGMCNPGAFMALMQRRKFS